MRKKHLRERTFARPLADLIGHAIDPILARRGFGQSNLIAFWEDIVGERLAAMSQPMKLQWPPRSFAAESGKGASATLVVRVESGFALELQHSADIVVARVNAHLGWRCVSRLSLKQGPVVQRSRAARTGAPIDPAAAQAAAELVSPIEDGPLRLALARLGGHVLSATRPNHPIEGQRGSTSSIEKVVRLSRDML